jgi:hypothetical protein
MNHRIGCCQQPCFLVWYLTSEDAIWDLQEINFMGVMSKNTPIKLISLITLCIDRDQIHFIDRK